MPIGGEEDMKEDLNRIEHSFDIFFIDNKVRKNLFWFSPLGKLKNPVFSTKITDNIRVYASGVTVFGIWTADGVPKGMHDLHTNGAWEVIVDKYVGNFAPLFFLRLEYKLRMLICSSCPALSVARGPRGWPSIARGCPITSLQ